MSTITVFSFVVVDVAKDLSLHFPSGFDFKGMLTKICDDAGVCIHLDKTVGGVCYKLQGLWCAIEKAHRLLTAAVDIHGVRPGEDGQDLDPPTDDTETPPGQKRSAVLSRNTNHRSRLKLLKLVVNNKDNQATPFTDIYGGPTSQNPKPHADIISIEPQKNSSEPHTDSQIKQKPPKTDTDSSVVGQLKQKTSRRKSKRMHKEKKIATDFVSSATPVCEESNTESTANDTHADLTLTLDEKHHGEQSDVANKQFASQRQESSHQNAPSNLCGLAAKEDVLKTIPEIEKNKTCLQPEKAQKRGRLRKSVPRQLSLVSHRYSFLSKYRDQSDSSIWKVVHKRKCVIPASSNECDSAVKKNQGDGQKNEEENHTRFSCSDCEFVSLSRSKLLGHVHSRHKGSPMCCDLCDKIFHRKTNMLRHRASHTGPQHCCDICGKMFKIQKAMINHRKTHEEGYTKPVFPCNLCEKTFCSQYIVDCHVRSFHLGQRKSYLCSFCGKKFTTKHSLQEHANAHTGIKPHICEICGKGFSYDSALRDHKFTHGDVKQFSCDVCDKSFCQRSGLKMHMRIHKDVKQFQCQECGRDFTQKQALQRHERVHKGVKPFTCKLCSRSFSDASIIRRHLTLIHKIHKDAKTWREDIVCTVQPDLEYHVTYMGSGEPGRQPVTPQTSKSHTEARTVLQTRAQSGKTTKKKNVSQNLKESSAVAGSHLPVHVQTVSSLSESIPDVPERELLTVPTSYSKGLLPVGAKVNSQDTSASPHIDKSLLQSLEGLPQAHNSAGIQLQSQDPNLSLACVTAPHTHSHSPFTTIHSTSRQGCPFSSVLPTTMEEAASLLCTNNAADSIIQPTAYHGPFSQSNTAGENYHRQHPYTLQQPHHNSKESSNLSGVTGSTSTTAGSTTTITAPQPWPSLYYYTQLASQFGMNLSDYPYVPSSAFSGLGLGPSSPGQQLPPPGCPRPQTLPPCLGVDHSSPFLPRVQSQGPVSNDLLQGHGCKDTRDIFGEGHRLMVTSPIVESSRSDLLLDGSGNVLNLNATDSSNSTTLPGGGSTLPTPGVSQN